MQTGQSTSLAIGALLVFACGLVPATAADADTGSTRAERVIAHWTPARRAQAIPRDLVIDRRGLGYLRRSDGALVPYGHGVAAGTAATPVPKAPPGGGDATPPQIAGLDPADGATIGASYTFRASVTDESGVKSVDFVITYPDGTTTQTFSPANTGGSTWSIALSGFTAGDWAWQVVAKDTAKRGGNVATSPLSGFSVGGGGGGGGGGDGTVPNAEWTGGGDIQQTAGRIYFEMPNNARRKGPWTGYVCSGTVVFDGASGRSVILTAAHCVYDDANGAFARNVLFIPDQAGTTGNGTDTNCGNDPVGCWVPSFGVVDGNWTEAVFPDNIPWDYAFYVVADGSGSHQPGLNPSSATLDVAVPALDVQFAAAAVDDGAAGAGSPDFTHALGYSYSEDPNFMYCAEDMTTEGADNWWLPSCGFSGGSSGGPWIQPLSNGTGPVISVNSWGYTGSPGMAGPKLTGSASCVYGGATSLAFPAAPADGDAGYALACN